MYRTSGAGDANVPALPLRRSAVSRQSPSTSGHQTFVQQRPTTSTGRLPVSSSSSSSRLNLSNLDQRVDSSRVRAMNDYREFPTTAAVTTTTTTLVVRHGDSHPVSRPPVDTDQTASPLRDVVGGDDDRGKKESKAPASKSLSSECRESIICQRCGRCRCDECARHKATGRRAVEICSCVSCFRHVVAIRRRRRRHRYDDNNDNDDDDDPCACSPCRSDCRRRWALLAVLSVCLPCLCFYWPLRCVVGACSRCAGRAAVRGCRCVERRTSDFGPAAVTPHESVVIDRVTST